MVTSITLIRHGETDWNVEARWQGFAPTPLNQQGIEQAQVAANGLKLAGITRIICSDLLRARQTAEIIAQALDLPVAFDRRWREVDVGNWQGLNQEEISAYDAENYTLFREKPYLERQFPDGETQQQHLERTMAALREHVVHFVGEHLLIVTHGGSIRSAVYGITGDRSGMMDNCAITRLRYTDRWEVIGVSEPVGMVWR